MWREVKDDSLQGSDVPSQTEWHNGVSIIQKDGTKTTLALASPICYGQSRIAGMASLMPQ